MPKTAQRTIDTSLTANKLAPKPCMHSAHGGELFHPPYAASSKLVRSHPRQHRISDKGDSTVVEGGTLLLATSKPWVASLGPLTVLKSPRDLAPPCQRQPPRQDGGPWDVASLVTDSPCPARGYSEFASGRCRGQVVFDVATVPWLGLLIAGVL